MATDHPTDRESGGPASPAEEDARVEAAVLAFVLDEHPDCLTIPELSRTLNEGSSDFARADAVERAIRELAHLSQEEVGFLASLHRTEVGQLERGVRLARIDTVVKLAGALEVAPGSLLDGMAWEPGEFAAGRPPPPDPSLVGGVLRVRADKF